MHRLKLHLSNFFAFVTFKLSENEMPKPHFDTENTKVSFSHVFVLDNWTEKYIDIVFLASFQEDILCHSSASQEVSQLRELAGVTWHLHRKANVQLSLSN